jgi:hypothetical protein
VRRSTPVFWPGFAVGIAFVVSSAATVSVQDHRAGARSRAVVSEQRAVPRTADRRLDLQGTWSFATLTPFERPDKFGGKDTLSDEEAEEYVKQTQETANKDRRDGTAAADVERAYNDFWWDFGTKASKQPSLVIDPPDGRLPPQTMEAQQRQKERRNRYDNPEERPLAERCILGFNSGPPMVPSAYNNNVQLVQTRDSVVILNEMIHSARIVPLNGRPHPPSHIRSLTGDSVGHWDRDTLVVDTTNFLKDGVFRGSTTSLHLVERFSLDDADTLRYEFTVTDPGTWTKPWTASVPMARSTALIYEYACHEANYGLEGVLRGARFADKQAPEGSR